MVECDQGDNPVYKLLVKNEDIIYEANGVLSRMWRIILFDLSIDITRWDFCLGEYYYKCMGNVAVKTLANIKGNMGKALTRNDMSWNIWCKGVSALGLHNPRMSIIVNHDGVTSELFIPMPFTVNEKRGGLLKDTWNTLTLTSYPKRYEEWDELISNYISVQRLRGEDLRNSIRSNLTQALSDKTLTWNTLIKGLAVMNFDKIVVSLCYTTGSRERLVSIKL